VWSNSGWRYCVRDNGALSAFRKALRQGSGRAMLILGQAPGDERLWDELLRACQRDLRFDRQCEDPRDGYLFRLIQRSGQGAFFIRELQRSLRSRTKDDEFDAGQMFAILCRLAADTRDFDRSWLRDWLFGENYEALGSNTLHAYVGFEGVAGLLFCVDHFSQAIDENIDQEDGWLLEALREALATRDGKESADAQVEAERAGNEALEQRRRGGAPRNAVPADGLRGGQGDLEITRTLPVQLDKVCLRTTVDTGGRRPSGGA